MLCGKIKIKFKQSCNLSMLVVLVVNSRKIQVNFFSALPSYPCSITVKLNRSATNLVKSAP